MKKKIINRRRDYKRKYERRKRVKNLMLAGHDLLAIQSRMKLNNQLVQDIYYDLIDERKKELKKDGKQIIRDNYVYFESKIHFGNKTEPYYDREEELMKLPIRYDYKGLSPDEKYIYDNPSEHEEDCGLNLEKTIRDYIESISTDESYKVSQKPEDEVYLIEEAKKKGSIFEVMRLEFYEATAGSQKHKQNG